MEKDSENSKINADKMKIIQENDFALAIRDKLANVQAKAVVGPGRSGAVAAVYASHILGIPFIPYGTKCPEHLQPLLIIDTAMKSGATLRKAERKYSYVDTKVVYIYDESGDNGRVRFWYENFF